MTLLEKFKKDHPNAPIDGCDGTPDTCPYALGYAEERCTMDGSGLCDCVTCWNQEYTVPDVEDIFKDCGKQNSEIIDTFKKGIESGDIKPHILDSGDRTEFETGAVRDMREGKGRCDLLPLDVIKLYYNRFNHNRTDIYHTLAHIETFIDCGDDEWLLGALHYSHVFPIDETLFLEVAKHFEEGAKKYGDNNWQKGIPVRCYIDSAIRHYLKYLRGDKDEPHDRAFCWNILCAIWTCKHKPELNDYKKEEVKENG